MSHPVSMTEAVGYASVDCSQENPAEQPLVLKHDRLFLLTDKHGDVVPPGICSLGLFHEDTRILSHYALSVAGGPPVLLSAQIPAAYEGQVDLAVNDLPFGGNRWDPKNVVHIRRQILLSDRMTERVTLASHLLTPLDYWVEVAFGCDFADIFEVRGWKRPARGQFYAPQAERDRLVFSYRGVDGVLVRSVIRFCHPPDRLTASWARWDLRLQAGEKIELEWEITAEIGEAASTGSLQGFDDTRTALNREYWAWRETASRWDTDNAEFDHLVRRATDDLRALYSEVDGESVITAGIPWYSTVFGRDSIITSLQTLPLSSRIAVETLTYLARRQGTKDDDYTEEQPGKILHELRRGEMARSGEIPHVPYYGSIDATPLWLILLHETWRWTGDHSLVRSLLPNADRALEWIDRYGDRDGDGFVEYFRLSEKGLANQGWKDSGDGVPFPDGSLPAPPIALIEVQGYVYDAKVRMAELYDSVGQSERAAALRKEARQLRERIRECFWVDELGMFALALDGEKRPVRTATSNAGHLLWSRVPTLPEAPRLAARFLEPDFFSGWGIRTLSSSHPVFNPMSYHNGSIWPHDNSILVLGMALHGQSRAALPVVTALYEAGVEADFQRLPELYCGMTRRSDSRPVGYPVSCSPQAWASGALFMSMQALLGLYPEAQGRILHVRDPVLPEFLNELTVSGISVCNSRLALQFRRHGSRTLANLIGIEGETLRVQIELS